MKVTLNYDQRAYHGKLNDLIYYWHPKAGRMIARRRPKQQKLTPGNERIRTVSRKLRDIHPSVEYAEDLRIYLQMLDREDRAAGIMNWYALYNRLMWQMQASVAGVDLTTLTREDIYRDGLPCVSVREAVLAGLLPEVRGFERFVAEI